MRKKGRYSARRQKAVMIAGGAVALLFAGSVIWLGASNWSAGQKLDRLGSENIQFDEFEEIAPSRDLEASLEIQDSENPRQAAEAAPKETKKNSAAENSRQEEQPKTAKPSSRAGYIEGQQLPADPKYIDGVLIANKWYPLPKDFEPGESKEAREAFEEMKASALTKGIELEAFSTYRSYDYQVMLYNRYVERDGEEAAERYSARPGYSEHQTGLAFDIGEVNHEKHWASVSFGETEAAKWLASNAFKFGFILRYPEGKEEITGYMHESWHYRYVGKQTAEQIFKRNITLEEYLGIH